MPYYINLTARALKLLKRLDPPARAFIIKELEYLKLNPYKVPQLVGKFSFLRSYHTNFRGVAYRIIFQVKETSKEILVHVLGPRSRVYDLLKRLFK